MYPTTTFATTYHSEEKKCYVYVIKIPTSHPVLPRLTTGVSAAGISHVSAIGRSAVAVTTGTIGSGEESTEDVIISTAGSGAEATAVVTTGTVGAEGGGLRVDSRSTAAVAADTGTAGVSTAS